MLDLMLRQQMMIGRITKPRVTRRVGNDAVFPLFGRHAKIGRRPKRESIGDRSAMLKSYEGIYRQGKVELLESPPVDAEGKVIVTFLDVGSVDLVERGIDEHQASDLRQRLKTFAEDWDRPEMDIYDAV